jgi:acetyl-CoA C-acetyltransferase
MCTSNTHWVSFRQLSAIIFGVQSIALGDNDIVVAGGMESMSNAPYYVPSARFGARMGNTHLVDGMIHDGLWDPYNNCHMGMAGELCAEEHAISRESQVSCIASVDTNHKCLLTDRYLVHMQDLYARQSFQRAVHASKHHLNASEIVPIAVVPGRGQAPIDFCVDESLECVDCDKFATLKPAFKPVGGTITAANASSVGDGMCAQGLAHVRIVC